MVGLFSLREKAPTKKKKKLATVRVGHFSLEKRLLKKLATVRVGHFSLEKRLLKIHEIYVIPIMKMAGTVATFYCPLS